VTRDVTVIAAGTLPSCRAGRCRARVPVHLVPWEDESVPKIEGVIKEAITRGADRRVRLVVVPLRREVHRLRRLVAQLRRDVGRSGWSRGSGSAPRSPPPSGLAFPRMKSKPHGSLLGSSRSSVRDSASVKWRWAGSWASAGGRSRSGSEGGRRHRSRIARRWWPSASVAGERSNGSWRMSRSVPRRAHAKPPREPR
jgi:hypothetical protein